MSKIEELHKKSGKFKEINKKVKEIIKEEIEKDPNFKELKRYITFLIVNPEWKVLVVYGKGGIGKSTVVKKVLDELKTEYNIKYKILQFVDLEYRNDIRKMLNIDIDEMEDIDINDLYEIFNKIKVDVLVLDDIRTSKRMQTFLGNLVENLNKKLIFIVNDTEELRSIGKVAYSRGLLLYYSLDRTTLRNIVSRIKSELNIELYGIPLNIRMLIGMINDIVFANLMNEKIDPKQVWFNWFGRILREKEDKIDVIEEIANALLSIKEYKSLKEFKEDIKDTLISYFYNRSTVEKKLAGKINKIATRLWIEKATFDKINEDDVER